MNCFDINFQHSFIHEDDEKLEQDVRVQCLGNFDKESHEKWIHIFIGQQEVTRLIKILSPDDYKDIESECEIQAEKWIENHYDNHGDENEKFDIEFEEQRDLSEAM